MNIFHKRSLSLILCIMLSGFVLFSYLDAKYRPYLLIVPCLVLILPLFFRRKRLFCLICAIGLLASMIYSYVYFDLWFDAGKRFDGEVTVTATVEEISYDDPRNSLTVRTQSIDGAPLSRYKLRFTAEREISDHLTVGNVIRFNANISSLTEKYTDDIASGMISDGVNGYAEINGEIMLISTGSIPLSVRLATMRENVRRYAVTLSDEDTGSLLAALLLGERDYLSPRLTIDFRRIGLSHILALSGMHLAVLAFAISKLLSFFGLGKRPATLVTLIFTALYVILTGSPISVVRAGIMLIISSLLTLISRTKDPLTNLSVSVFIILAVTPYSYLDVSLWLSAAATLGLVSINTTSLKEEAEVTEYGRSANKTVKERRIERIQNIAKRIASSVFAIGATLLLSSTYFGYVSILSPISTFIFSPLIVLFMYVGMLLLGIGTIIPFGGVLIKLNGLIEIMVSKMSSLDDIYVSTNYFAAEIAIYVFTALLILFLIFKIKRKRAYIFTLSLSLVAIFALTFTLNFTASLNNSTAVYADDDSSKILVKSESSTLLISSGLHSENSAYHTVDLLGAMQTSELDALFITHYSYSLPKELGVLLKYVKIDRIYLPAPENKSERDLELLATRAISDFETETVFYNTSGKINLGEIAIDPIYRVIYGEGSVKCALSFTASGKRTVYLSSGMLDSETHDLVIDEMSPADTLIFGIHGRKYKETIYLDERITPPAEIILLSKNLELHAYDELYYKENGTKITFKDGSSFLEIIE